MHPRTKKKKVVAVDKYFIKKRGGGGVTLLTTLKSGCVCLYLLCGFHTSLSRGVDAKS